jgi:hypothetical protein
MSIPAARLVRDQETNMIRTISWALALAAIGASACGDDASFDPFGNDGGGGGSAGRGGSAGSGGSAGRGGAGGSAGTGGSTAGTGGSAAGRAGTGGSAAGTGGSAAGTAGTAGTGDAPDAGDSGAPGSVDAGSCTEVTSLPYSEPWQTTDGNGADLVDILGCQLCDNTDDYIITFTAPATASYRFFASSSGDVELAVYPGGCGTAPNDVSCGEDIDADNEDYDDQVVVELDEGEGVTVVVGESCEESGGAGSLTIDIVP